MEFNIQVLAYCIAAVIDYSRHAFTGRLLGAILNTLPIPAVKQPMIALTTSECRAASGISVT
jgi:hypothetical protein